MTLHVALLRAVNLAGKRSVAMSDLRSLAARLGLEDARSVLQSGNLVFGCSGKRTAEIERLLEAETEKRLGLVTDFFVRTIGEWRDVVARNPFPEEARRDPARLLALFLKSAPAAAQVRALEAAIRGRELVRADGRHVYAVYPDGIGTSKLTNALLTKHLGSPCTGRNWNTVLRLAGG